MRTAVGTDSEARLAKEESFYRDLHKGTETTSTVSASPRAPSVSPPRTRARPQTELSRYRALDTVVVRGLASATVEDMGAVAEAGAPGV